MISWSQTTRLILHYTNQRCSWITGIMKFKWKLVIQFITPVCENKVIFLINAHGLTHRGCLLEWKVKSAPSSPVCFTVLVCLQAWYVCVHAWVKLLEGLRWLDTSRHIKLVPNWPVIILLASMCVCLFACLSAYVCGGSTCPPWCLPDATLTQTLWPEDVRKMDCVCVCECRIRGCWLMWENQTGRSGECTLTRQSWTAWHVLAARQYSCTLYSHNTQWGN